MPSYTPGYESKLQPQREAKTWTWTMSLSLLWTASWDDELNSASGATKAWGPLVAALLGMSLNYSQWPWAGLKCSQRRRPRLGAT